METCFIPASVEVAARRPSVIPISAGQCQLVVHRRHGVQLINHELLSLAGLVGLAVLATVHPAFHAWCVLDRDALAAGEVWRLWTGHLTHFSASHLVVDALVFTLLAAALRRAGERTRTRAVSRWSCLECEPARLRQLARPIRRTLGAERVAGGSARAALGSGGGTAAIVRAGSTRGRRWEVHARFHRAWESERGV